MSECPVDQPTDEVLRPLPLPAGRSPLIPVGKDSPRADNATLAANQDARLGEDAGADTRPGGPDARLDGSEDAVGGSRDTRPGGNQDAVAGSEDAGRRSRLARAGWALYRLPAWVALSGWRPPEDTAWIAFLAQRRRLAASYGRHGMLSRFEPLEDRSHGALLYRAVVSQDTSALADTGWLDRVEAIARLEARLAALKAEAIAGYDDAQHGICADLGHARPEPGDRAATAGERRWHHGQLRSVSDEIGLVLGLHRGAATSRIHSSWELVHNYPATWAALAEGELTERAAFTIVSELSVLEDLDDLRAAEAAVLDWARQHPLQRIKQAAQREAASRDAAATDKSHQRARDDRSVRMVSTDFGIADLIHSHDAADAAAVMTSLSRAALYRRRQGDPRTMDQLRADIALARLLPRTKHATNPTPNTTDTTDTTVDVNIDTKTEAHTDTDTATDVDSGTGTGRDADSGTGRDADSGTGRDAGFGGGPVSADHAGPVRTDADSGYGDGAFHDRDGSDRAYPDDACSDDDHSDGDHGDGAYADDAYADGDYADPDASAAGEARHDPDSDIPDRDGGGEVDGDGDDDDDDDDDGVVDEATIGADARVTIHATGAELRALLNGDENTGGELEGHGPIPQNALRKALIKALTQTLLPALPTTPTNSRRSTRANTSRIDIRITDQPPTSDPNKYTPSAALDRYIRLRDRTCRFPGCNRPAEFTDIDHREPFATGGKTTAENLHCLCRHHHRLKHEGNWTVHRNPDGSQTWTSPTGRQYRDDNPDP